MSCYGIVNYLLELYATDDNIDTVESNIQASRAQCLTGLEFAQQLWSDKPRCGSVFSEKVLSGIFVKKIIRLICRSLRQWSVEN